MIFKGRQEIKQAQEKLNTSLNTPIADAEIRVLEKGTWLSEVKDMTRRFNTLPPIQQGNKVKKNAMAFTIDWNPWNRLKSNYYYLTGHQTWKKATRPPQARYFYTVILIFLNT